MSHTLEGNLDSGIWEILESWVLESGIQLKDSGILLTIGIQNPSSTDKYWNPVRGIRNPLRGIQNPRLSWISLHEAIWANNRVPECDVIKTMIKLVNLWDLSSKFDLGLGLDQSQI